MTLSDEDLFILRKKLTYRAWHRGTKEMDLILGTFADRNVATMDLEELQNFSAILELPDQEMYSWMKDASALPDQHDTALMRRIIKQKLNADDKLA